MALSRRSTKSPGKASDSQAAASASGNTVRIPRDGAPDPASGSGSGIHSEEYTTESDVTIHDARSSGTMAARKNTPNRQNSRPSGIGKASRATIPEEGDSKPAARISGKAAREGSEIGSLKRRGMPLTWKLSLFTFFVTTLVTIIFFMVSMRGLESQLMDEIKRSGYQEVLGLHAFGQRVIADRFLGIRNQGALVAALDNYKKAPDPKISGATRTWYATDLALLQKIVDADKRIKDVAIFVWPTAVDNPSIPVICVKKPESFAQPPPTTLTVNVEHPDPDVQIYPGSYAGEPCLYFRMPLEKGLSKEMYSSINLILSVGEINNQVKGLQTQLILFGILLTALGVGLSFGLASRISRPINNLVDDINAVSQGDLDHESTVPNQTSDEVGLLAMAFNRMTKNLRDARAMERDIERINSELDTAKKIHFNLLPDKLPQLPGIDIANEYKSAKEVGGDYYDFIPVGDAQHLAFTVADVSGKGIPGSMVMGTTRNILRLMSINNLSAADVLAKTNFHVAKDIKRGMFVTCVYAILNVNTKMMTVASAGHNPMLIWRQATASIEKVRPNGIALGFDKGPIFNRTVREQKVQLNSGDRVVLYTDGVVEAMDEKHREWSDEALDEFTLKNAKLSSKEFVRLLLKELEIHQGNGEQHDDITVTTFRIA